MFTDAEFDFVWRTSVDVGMIMAVIAHVPFRINLLVI